MEAISALKWLVDKLLELRGKAAAKSAAQWDALATHADRTANVVERAIKQFEAGEPLEETSEEAYIMERALRDLDLGESDSVKTELYVALCDATLDANSIIDEEGFPEHDEPLLEIKHIMWNNQKYAGEKWGEKYREQQRRRILKQARRIVGSLRGLAQALRLRKEFD